MTSDEKQPGRFSLLEATTGEPPFVEVVDDLTRAGHDAVVDEMGLGALFLRADDCEKLLTDRRFGAVAMPVLAMSGVTEGPIHDLWSALMFGKDGDDHRRIRNVVAKGFTRAGVERYRDHSTPRPSRWRSPYPKASSSICGRATRCPWRVEPSATSWMCRSLTLRRSSSGRSTS